MDREAALNALESRDSDERLRGARSLADSAQPEDAERLRAIRRLESVPWVRSALDTALRRAETVSAELERSPEAEDDGDDVSDPTAVYREGLEQALDRIVHELRTIVGTLRYWVQKEMPEFDRSETSRQVERLRKCLEAIDVLATVAQSTTREEFDLGKLIDDEIASLDVAGDPIECAGPSPFVVLSDGGIIALIVRNALVNAVEAAREGSPEITVSWGETDEEYWLAVFDRGVGLPGESEPLFDFGSSNKYGHVGAGLTIVSQAALAIYGAIGLSEDADGSTKFELRWPRAKVS